MDNLLVYKGFSARIEFDARDNIFFGRILGIEDLVTNILLSIILKQLFPVG